MALVTGGGSAMGAGSTGRSSLGGGATTVPREPRRTGWASTTAPATIGPRRPSLHPRRLARWYGDLTRRWSLSHYGQRLGDCARGYRRRGGIGLWVMFTGRAPGLQAQLALQDLRRVRSMIRSLMAGMLASGEASTPAARQRHFPGWRGRNDLADSLQFVEAVPRVCATYSTCSAA